MRWRPTMSLDGPKPNRALPNTRLDLRDVGRSITVAASDIAASEKEDMFVWHQALARRSTARR
jgi:hypothetical protein